MDGSGSGGKYHTWLLGDWRPKNMDLGLTDDITEAARFLRGEVDLGLEPDTAAALRQMFASQERWRSSVENSLKELVAHFQAKAAPLVGDMLLPSSDEVEQAQRWKAQGAYAAHTEDANHVMHAIEDGWVLK